MNTFCNRRRFVAGAAVLATSTAWAQASYPAKGPIRVIVPLPAGGAADVSTRIVTSALQAQLGQSVIVDNKPGGSFTIGMNALAQAPADGYTLFYVNTGMCTAQAALRKYDMLKALVPISSIGTMPAVLSVPAASPIRSVKELVAMAKAHPGTLNYGSVGLGSLEHLWGSRFAREQGVEMVHIPFKGMPDAVLALSAGEIQLLPLILSLALPHVQKGLVRPLAVLDAQRHPLLPDVPTMREAGFDAMPVAFWGGLAAPAGAPAAVIDQLHRAIVAALRDSALQDKLKVMGTLPVVSDSPQAFRRQIEGELRWMTAAVKDANLQLN